MAYAYLLLAIGFEVAGTSLLKPSEGFTRPWPTVGTLGAYALSFFFLSQAVRDLPVGVVYALWAGLGTVAIVGIAAAFLGEPLTATKLLGIALVVGGVVILNLDGAH
ncbi:multidrug efflux SMR transporter [Nocardioides panacisoli]|uniref:DMT family transporter n=1 Tax=Nocardioides panacisoli TaxID=627624 RepID=UPI001C625870|nr:multidrug efflux SMR transporter [Nocardioides panacisoli]QYJ03450.1 multidrug efflux SMR transporter [Nocardioides panacisoli]